MKEKPSQKDIFTLETIIEFENHPELSGGICATSPGEVSRLRKLERMGLVKCAGRCYLHSDFYDPYCHAEGSQYLSFEITGAGRTAIEKMQGDNV
jgi:hypothetical protein